LEPALRNYQVNQENEKLDQNGYAVYARDGGVICVFKIARRASAGACVFDDERCCHAGRKVVHAQIVTTKISKIWAHMAAVLGKTRGALDALEGGLGSGALCEELEHELRATRQT
jgi:hypothetical protein